jgi:integrase
MATVTKRTGVRGSSFLAQARVTGFKTANQTFRVADYADARSAEKTAAAWAEAREAELRQAKAGGIRRDVAALTVRGLIAEYRSDAEVRARRSFADVERLTQWWADNYGNARALDLNVLMLRAARDNLQKKERSNATTNRYLSSMRSAWNWARAGGLIPADRHWPARLMLTEPRGRTRFLNDEEVTALLKAAESDNVMRTAIIASIATGVRQGEMLRLQWKDIDLAGAKLTVHKSKNDQKRTVYLPPSARAALKELKESPVAHVTAVFVTANGLPLRKSWLETRWNKIRTAAKLNDFRWHDLRHSCASYLAQSGANLLEIGSQLGHKSPSVTLRYAHLLQGKALAAHAGLEAKFHGKA